MAAKPTRTAADCNGYLVATSHVTASRGTATLSGTIVNETGFDVTVSTIAPVVSAFDTTGEHVVLFGSFDANPGPYGGEGGTFTLKPGGSIPYRSQAVPMQTPDRNWDGSRGWAPLAQFSDFDVINFCQQRVVLDVHLVE